MQTIPTATPPQPRATHLSTWLLAAGMTIILLVALGVGIVVFAGNNSSPLATASSRQLASAQLTSVQQSCEQWSGSSAPTGANGSPTAAWCTTMTSWMGQQLNSGHRTAAMMWGSATTLQTTCQQWMAGGSGSTGSGTASPAWCGPMANSMAQRVGNWSSFMMNGTMMGR